MKEVQAIPELRRLKDKWKKLYEEGKDKDKYERRALLRQMNRIEGDIAKISDKHILDAITSCRMRNWMRSGARR